MDVRVICATHKDLKSLTADGSFREDLYYRLAEITLPLPPLRERAGDATLIARAIATEYAHKNGLPAKPFSDRAMHAIETYQWPGNVRELENKVKRAMVMADGKQIEPVDLELEDDGEPTLPTLREVRDRAEMELLKRALTRSNGQVTKAADLLGISRPTMYHLLKKFGMDYA